MTTLPAAVQAKAMGRKRILFFEPPAGITSGMKYHLNNVMQQGGINAGDCFYINCFKAFKDGYLVQQKGNRTYYKGGKSREARAGVQRVIDEFITRIRPDFIVINDPAVLLHFSGEQQSISACRGSIYTYRGIYAACIDDLYRMKDTQAGMWIAVNDWKKIGRFIYGKYHQEPVFRYHVCHTLLDLQWASYALLRSPYHSVDIETSGELITSVAYTFRCTKVIWEQRFAGPREVELKDGELSDEYLCSIVIPFLNPTRESGCHWESAALEEIAWSLIRNVNACDSIKILQNGSYDASYFIRYGCPLFNYLLDSMHMWHCLYAQISKSLDFIASICVDHYWFWKEESKGVDDDNIPDERDMERFWRYNALDTYYVALIVFNLLQAFLRTDWAVRNYNLEFRSQVGPALSHACRGMLLDRERLKHHQTKWSGEHDKRLNRIRTAVADVAFNPNSPDQVQQLFYKVLGAQPVKAGGKTGAANEVTLKLLSDQHPLIKWYADMILDCKESGTLLSRYLYPYVRRKRFHYSQNAAGTYTSRYSSSPFMWEGQNAQNIPDHLRDILTSSGPDYILFDADLEQSDARFIYYEAQDLNGIRNVTSGKDTHCLHAAHFFKEPYDRIYERVQVKDPKYAHPVTGIRSVTKRIVHGTNFQMAAYTLFTTMGRDAVVAAAKAIGHLRAERFTRNELVGVCEIFLEEYHVLYPRLRPWYKEIESILRQHHRISTSFGWTCVFFGNSDDPSVQRDATAFYGQGNTGGLINRTLLDVYYGNDDGRNIHQNLRLLLQVHDSIVGETKPATIGKIADLLEIMERPVTIHGRECSIPAACKIGYRWGDSNMVKVTKQELRSGQAIEKLMKFLMEPKNAGARHFLKAT